MLTYLDYPQFPDSVDPKVRHAFKRAFDLIYGLHGITQPLQQGHVLTKAEAKTAYDAPNVKPRLEAGGDAPINLDNLLGRPAYNPERFYMGYFRNADVVRTPTATETDGYVYTRPECIYFLIHASTVSPGGGFTPGQPLFPAALAANAGVGALLATPYRMFIEGSTGANPGRITLSNNYDVSGEVFEGTVAVYCLAQKGSTGG